ncbi:Bestrophin, RFP-TM, chloride channel-domain-containing protein [Lactarius akahatsu]|uniref:Bestrophin, RFP-TM, chloride channel-domain-containing protein n=1 Tax=Lactarius akahatsu TaxID=416441 RepID=A0AAD4LUU2_9AGAM|nr:Bestrophin, RFP-TM, chloride channel-domain-containing protein [Lactarius akahatsu]
MPAATLSPSALPRQRKLLTRKQLRKYSWIPDVLRLKNSIVNHIIGPVLTVSLFSAAVVYAYEKGQPVMLTNSVTPLLSVVVGLILVFRYVSNGTSYDRYYEGRKSFGSITSQARNLARLIWIQVALPPTDDISGKTPSTDITPLQLRRRKTNALKLILSFVYAVKHYLREEDGLDWEDYVGVLPASFMREQSRLQSRRGSISTFYNSVTDNASSSGNSRSVSPLRGASTDGSTTPAATKRVRVKRSLDKIHTAKSPLLSGPREHSAIDFEQYTEISMPFPLVIAHELTRMLFAFRKDGLLETVGPAGVNSMNTTVSSLVDQLTNVERIANTPIPKSYGIHLKQCVTLYLFSLPFVLVRELGWATVPIVTIVSFTFMGIEGIAEQIEMPFGLDETDLPLDRYCSDLKEEINYVLENLPEGGIGGYGWDDGHGDD